MTTILLVEDTLDLAQVILRELEVAGYQLRHVVDGHSALRELEKQAPELVILDWMIPGLDGLEVLRRLRLVSAIPVLMLTARSEETDRVLGLELGADDYLTKPFSMRELVARVRALLRRNERLHEMLLADRSGGNNTPIYYGGLCLDPQAHLATLEGKPLDLSRTEFSLLQLLLHNPGRAFSRPYLLDTVWGETHFEGDRSVDNAIMRLRKKLSPMSDIIESVWGVGYRLKPDSNQ
jgi:DNA-binding response OmpR family regulator